MSNDLRVTLSLVDNFTQKLTGVQAHLGKLGSQIDNINKIATRFGVGLGLGTVGFKIVDELKALATEAKAYTVTQNQLREALGYTSIELSKQADELEKKYFVDDREIAKVQQRLALYTQDEGAIKQLTDATLNYAAATGKDAVEATTMIDRAIVSAKGTLRGFPGTLEGAAGSSERLASIVEILNGHMHGQAQAVADSKTWWDRLKLSVDNVRESLSVSLFGKDAEKEMMRYKQALEFTEKYYGLSAVLQKQQKQEYIDDLAFIQEYEKKIGDAKVNAQRETQERLAADTAKKMNLTPGFKDNAAAISARKKAAEDEEREKEELAKESIRITEKLTEQDAQANAKRQAEQLKREQANRDNTLALNEEIDRFMEEGQKRQEASDKRAEDEAMRHKEVMAQTAVSLGESYGAAIGQGIGKGEAGLKSALKGVLNTTIDFIERQVIAAIVSNTVRDFGMYGPVGLVVGAAEAAGITAIAEAAKAGISSFSMGTNYAPGGAAFVHKDESIYLPRGSQVKTASETRQITNNNNAGHTITVNVTDMSGGLVDTITTQIRNGSTGTDRLLKALSARLA